VNAGDQEDVDGDVLARAAAQAVYPYVRSHLVQIVAFMERGPVVLPTGIPEVIKNG
jgi:hypothetical protein